MTLKTRDQEIHDTSLSCHFSYCLRMIVSAWYALLQPLFAGPSV